ncbi:SPFH domain-containing protein [Gordonia sp. (in: high G+C Gram-positive bacteria)]|uniref:SPFH domain-containing protein n=1 Tax=Gordonia sp. (in: high G+C Gram-positive bacteria) TaxID=84139 RepID=UPI00391B885F
MPTPFIIFLVLAVIAIIVTVAAKLIHHRNRDQRDADEIRTIGRIATGTAWTLALIPLVISCTTIVSTRNIGVVTKFGRPTGTDLTNGLHLKSPLAKVHEMDGAMQILNRTGKDATTVRLGNNSLAQVDNTIRWRIVPAAAPALYLDYRSFDGVRDNLVTRQANAALNEVLGGFNPLTSLESQDNENQNVELANKVAEVLRTKVGRQIVVEQVIIPVVRFDAETQKRIDAFNTEVANTRVAEQRQKTAKADAEANRIIADSVKNDPNVVTARCIDQAIKAGISPAGCWPGGSVITGVK